MNPTSIRSGVGAAQESFRLGAVVHLPRRRQVVEDAALDALGDVMRIVPDDKAERQPEQGHLCSLRSLAVQVASIVQHVRVVHAQLPAYALCRIMPLDPELRAC